MGMGLLLAVGGLLFEGGLPQARGQGECSLASLHGKYIFRDDGVIIQDNQQLPFAVAGIQTYNGDGTLSSQLTQSLNGEITQHSFTGTYTVEPTKCTGTFTLMDEHDGTLLHFDQFLSPDGNELTFVHTDPGFVSSASQRRVTRFQTLDGKK